MGGGVAALLLCPWPARPRPHRGHIRNLFPQATTKLFVVRPAAAPSQWRRQNLDCRALGLSVTSLPRPHRGVPVPMFLVVPIRSVRHLPGRGPIAARRRTPTACGTGSPSRYPLSMTRRPAMAPSQPCAYSARAWAKQCPQLVRQQPYHRYSCAHHMISCSSCPRSGRGPIAGSTTTAGRVA